MQNGVSRVPTPPEIRSCGLRRAALFGSRLAAVLEQPQAAIGRPKGGGCELAHLRKIACAALRVARLGFENDRKIMRRERDAACGRLFAGLRGVVKGTREQGFPDARLFLARYQTVARQLDADRRSGQP